MPSEIIPVRVDSQDGGNADTTTQADPQRELSPPSTRVDKVEGLITKLFTPLKSEFNEADDVSFSEDSLTSYLRRPFRWKNVNIFKPIICLTRVLFNGLNFCQ